MLRKIQKIISTDKIFKKKKQFVEFQKGFQIKKIQKKKAFS